MDIKILSSTYCEVGPALAKIINPILSYPYEYWRQGMFKKERKEGIFSIMLSSRESSRFPTGLLPDVIQYCKDKQVPIKVFGEVQKLPFKAPILKTLTLKDAQPRILQALFEKQRGVYVSPTGTGKTAIGIACISGFMQAVEDFRVVWLSHTQDLMYQSASVCKKELGISPGIIGDNKADMDGQIIMATRQSMIKYVDYFYDKLDMIFVDEAHHISDYDGQYGKILMNIPCPVRIGATATMPPDKKRELAIKGMLGPIIEQVTIQEAIGINILATPKIKILRIPTDKNIQEIRAYTDVYRYGVVTREDQHKIIAKKAKEHVMNNESVLIMVTRIDHGRYLYRACLAEGIEVEFAEGATTTKDRIHIKESLNSKKLLCAIATTIWAEGVDIPELNILINAAGGKTEIPVLQKIGRGLRKTNTKTNLIVYDCFDDSHWKFVEHFGHRMSTYTEMGWL